ncbi:MAG: hypothetical protein P1V34_08860 [Alphaproteobacteria bacterium]|nr:hypothetical protein [Alphaproteobacteria bacterium]
MKKLIALIVFLVVLAGGVVAAYPVYKQFIEQRIADTIAIRNQSSVNDTITYDTLTVDPIDSRIVIEGLTLKRRYQVIKVARADLITDSFLLLTEVHRVTNGQLEGVSIWTADEDVTVTAQTASIAGLSWNPKGFPFPLQSSDYLTNFKDVSLESLSLDTVMLTDKKEDLQFPIATATLNNLSNGVLSSLTFNDMTFSENGVDVILGSTVFSHIDIAALVQLTENPKIAMQPKPLAIEWLSTVSLEGFAMQDLTMSVEGEADTRVESLALSNLSYSDTIPVSMTLTYDGVDTPITEQTRQDYQQRFGSEIYLNLPDRVISRGSVQYELDLPNDRLTISALTYDSVSDIQTQYDFDVQNIQGVVNAIWAQREPNQQEIMLIALKSLSISAKNMSQWQKPERVDGKQTPRLFVSETLQTMLTAEPMKSLIAQPVDDFLSKGGTLVLSMKPQQPLTLIDLIGLSAAPMPQIFQDVGLTATYQENP